jgi:hypothetical protein
MKLRAGQKLQSAISDVQVVVVRAPAAEVEVGCGGTPVVAEGQASDGTAQIDAADTDGPQLGKRYADEELGIELLCVRGGAGALTVNGRTLAVKNAKPLPASD